MSNIFSVMDRKSKREFNKLPDNKKLDVFNTAIIEKVSGVMSKEIAKSIIKGMEMQREKLYQDYVERIDSSVDPIEKENIISSLLSYLRLEHLNCLKQSKLEQIEHYENKNGGDKS